jgi:hypothetical protein
MRVYMSIPNLYQGFRELEMFCAVVNNAWSTTGQIFPMYDPETLEIFEVAFNTVHGALCAYDIVPFETFRKKTKGLKP